MTIPVRPDVLVAGAGPAGCIAATALARQGLRVLLADGDGSGPDRHVRAQQNMTGDGGPNGRFGAAPGYHVLVSGPALRGLTSLDVSILAPSARVDAIDLRFGTRSRRQITGCGAAVYDRRQLREALRHAAASAGTHIVAGKVTSLHHDRTGHTAMIAMDGSRAEVCPAHVVIGSGACGLPALTAHSPKHAIGVACAQRFTGVTLGSAMTLALAPPSTSHPDEQPACAWALPSGDGTITVGTARVAGGRAASPAELLDEAVRTLAEADRRFTLIRPAGPIISGPLNTGFAPGRLAGADGLLVGDAAGLVNPFTAEGLSYAVQSGLLAAQAIASNRADPGAAHRRYTREMATTFIGHFETARHAARRYHLAWRILAAGAASDHPFFAKGRRAILLPEGFSGLTATERMDLTDPDTVLLAPFLVACDEVAIATVRTEWPFLARLVIAGEGLAHHRLRPAVPFFAAMMAAGSKPDIRRATLGAAVELAMLGALAMLGPAPPPARGRGIDWALTATVLAGDFLLAQSSRLVADYAPEVSWSFADWLAEMTALRAARLARRRGAPAGAVYASLMEFPARIGGLLGGGSPATVQALRDFGHATGCAFGAVEDVLALRGERTRLDTTLAAMLEGRFTAIADCLDAQPAAGQIAADPRLRARALAVAADTCEDGRRRALKAITAVPDPAAARILRGFIDTVTAPIRADGHRA